MHIENHTIASHFARAYLNSAERQGLDIEHLLNVSGLTKSLIQEPKARIAPQQLANIVRLQMKLGNDEFAGHTERRCQYGVFTLLAEQLIHCATLKDVLQHTVRFFNLITEDITLSLNESDREAHFTLTLSKPELDLEHLLVEFLLIIWHRFPSWLIGQVINLKEVWFDYPEPGHAMEYRLLYPCPCRFNAGINALIFDASQLQLPVIQQPDQLTPYLLNVPLHWFRKQAFYEDYTTRVMLLLEQHDKIHLQTIGNIAEQLHMTSRTLRRKLTSESNSFQKIKDNLRRDQAINLLNKPNITINEVSQRLGFTEAATFIRAFKQWTGLSPGNYRKKEP